MKFSRLLFLATCFGAAISSPGALAAIDSTAAVVQLRTSCLENQQTLNNCFTDLNTLATWIWGTRKPAQANPLLVSIGLGTFNGMLVFECGPSAEDWYRISGGYREHRPTELFFSESQQPYHLNGILPQHVF